MPVPLIAPTGSKVSLQTIFSQSFGTSTPGFYSITLLRPKQPKNTTRTTSSGASPLAQCVVCKRHAGDLQMLPYTVSVHGHGQC